VILRLLYAFDDVLIQPFVPDSAVVTLDAGVLLRLSGLDVKDGNPLFLSPFHQLSADVFRPVVGSCRAGFAAPFDDAVKASDHAFRWQRKIDLDAQTLAVKIVQHVQEPKRPTVPEAIRHEVHRPHHVRRFWHRQRIGFIPLQPSAGLDPQVQLKLAVNPPDGDCRQSPDGQRDKLVPDYA